MTTRPWRFAASGQVRAGPARLVAVALLGLAVCAILLSCGGGGDPDPKGAEDGAPLSLLEGEWGAKWRAIDIRDQGAVEVTGEGVLRMGAGKPLTGAVFGGGDTFGLPTRDYVVEFEARRVEGSDFFATLTFPVGSVERCASLVLGGWGGSLVGISSIDHLDASENGTRASLPFENGRWYRVKLEVTEARIRAWVDGRITVNAAISGRVVGMRPGDIEQCAPFGFATYWSVGEVRGLVIAGAKREGN